MNDTDPRYDQLRMRYAGSLPRKHDDLAQAWRAFAEKPGDAIARRDLHAQIHRLSGSAPSYGYADLGALARATDALMSQPDMRDPALQQAPTDCVRRLAVLVPALLAALVAAAALATKELPAIP